MSHWNDIPDELRSLPNWVVWRTEQRTNTAGITRTTKVPYCARNQTRAKSNDPHTWSTFGAALTALKRGYDGVGFCLSPPYVGIDLDGCRPNGTDEEWAAQIIRELDSYTETSPSETGVHVMCKGELPEGQRQKDFKDRDHHGVGLYDAAGARYLTMTGSRIQGSVIAERTQELRRIHMRLFGAEKARAASATQGGSAGPSGDDQLIQRARAAHDGGKFSRLWDGQWKGDYGSQSEADLALCMKLAFWTDCDASRIDALFRRSGLMRDKWNRDDYRLVTIAKAVEQSSETYKPRRRQVATIHLDAFEPNLQVLNALAVFQGRIRFTGVKRRGPMVIATVTSGREIIWPSTAELASFHMSQAIIGDATNIWIPTPPYGQRAQWEPAIHLLLQLAAADQQSLEPALKEETRDLLQLVWRAAGQPAATEGYEFCEILRQLRLARRNPVGVIPPCVFIAEESVWVHVPTFRLWLSIPSLTNKQPALADVRNGLLLLGFTYRENLHRSCEGDSETACLWQGPLDVL